MIIVCDYETMFLWYLGWLRKSGWLMVFIEEMLPNGFSKET